jgi:hypothetical protein
MPRVLNYFPRYKPVRSHQQFSDFCRVKLVWRSSLYRVVLGCFHRNASPFLQPVGDPLDVRVLVNAQMLARPAALFEDHRVVGVVTEPADLDGDLLAAPAGAGTLWVSARESTHDAGAVVFDDLGVASAGE